MKKAEIRKIVLAQRTELPEKEFRERSQRVIEFLTPFLTPGKTIASFKAIPHRNEISLDSLEGDFAFPRVISAAEGTMEMVLASEFTSSEWGIPEPVGGTVVKPTDFDIVLIPLLAFDKNGQRVGYGKGFYDRYLALCRPDCLKIGISLFDPVDLIEQVESHDIPLDIAICPTILYDFR
ncbi:5-formyltetrahydrofolate cyclo-ligase [Aquirufa sp. KTFRIE-69F]|uniref:5-formyltetrahydrofolate cyclo-ligase n=1 Tax=Aquirufa originis TaxID=3096514 RepID=A0ABW6D4I6_9BACT